MSDHDLVSRIFLQACELGPEERDAFLGEACVGRPELREEVEAMLAADERAADADATAGMAAGVERLAASVAAGSPERIGPYKVLELLGEGGMGAVYRAQQTEPIRREVALKVLRVGMDSQAFLARFEAERRTLAAMDHPNITRVLDAGADDEGRPYLVMELVHGVPLSRFVSENDLDLKARLSLFLGISRAIGHAHQRGVIHRDLKPSNILVTRVHGEPMPKIIDFSIAKALDEPSLETAFRTVTGQVIGTLEYMSPEQATGDVGAIDTRSDVYSLGVVLYELLTGELPYDLTGQPLHEAVRRIAEEPPRTLRGTATAITLRGTGDLETIVAKCLEKDPDRRYGGSLQLAEDVERHLDSRPILARPPSTAYQLRKLVARHRIGFSLVALSFLFLVAFGVTVTVQLQEQRRQRARAEAEAAKAKRVVEFMQDVYRAADNQLGHDASIREALKLATEKLEAEETEQPLARAAILQALGRSYGKFNEFEEAYRLLDQSRAILEETLEPDDKEIGEIYWYIAVNRHSAQRFPESEQALQRAIAVHERYAEDDPEPLVSDLGLLGLLMLFQNRVAEAEAIFRRQIGMYDQLPDTRENWIDRGTARENLANALQRKGRVAEAATIVREVMLEREEKGVDNGMNRFNLAFLLKRQGNCEEAEELFQSVIDNTEAFHGRNHPVVANALRQLGQCLGERRRYEEGEAVIRESLEIAREVFGEESMAYAGALRFLGVLLTGAGELEEAEAALRAAMAIHAKDFGDESGIVAGYRTDLADVFEAAGEWRKAEEALRGALAMVEKVLEPDDVQIAYRLSDLVEFLCRRERFEEAAPLHERALVLLTAHHDAGSPELAKARELQAWILDGLGRFDEAESYRGQALAWARRVLGDEHARIARLLCGRAAALRRQGRLEEALSAAQEAASMQRRLFGDRDGELAVTLLETAEILAAQHRLEEAATSARTALAIWEQRRFVDPSLLARARSHADRSS